MTAVPLDRLFVSGRDPESLVAVRDGTPLRFAGFAADVARVAGAVRAVGALRGAVVSADPYWFLVGLFGLLHAGAAAIVPPDGLPATIAALSGAFDVLLCDEASPTPGPVIRLADPLAGDAAIPAPLDPATARLAFFTSGSTGTAKRIDKPLDMLNREIATLETRWATRPGGLPVLATVPHRHVFGLTFHLLWPLATGRPFASHIDDLWETLLARATGGAILVTSPAHLTRLSGLAPLPAHRRPVRIFAAGAPLRAAQARAAAAVLGVLPTEVFGSTETGAIATRTQPVAETSWTPLPGIQLRTDADGCMIVHAPLGPDGAPFCSADRIEPVADGTFHFLGRTDRIAKIEGKRVSLVRLETELAALPLVADAAAVVAGERLSAAVVLTPDGCARLDAIGPFRFGRELRRQLAVALEPASLPKSWRFVPALPSSAMGKRLDADIRRLFAS